MILAEHYGNPEGWLLGDEWDTVMNYDAFMEPVTWFLTGMEKHSDEYRPDLCGNSDVFIDSMKTHMRSLHMSALQTAMNELSNHDHSRFLTRTNSRVGRVSYAGAEAASQGINPAIMREAVAIQMTWPGSPTVYYGDEAGVCGFTDPDNRRTYPWGHEDKELIAFHREMIRIHKENPALKTGSLTFLNGADNQLCYARFNRQQQFVIIINNDERDCHLDLSVWAAYLPRYGQLERVMLSYDDGYNMNPVIYEIRHGRIEITLPKHSAAILKNRS